MARLVCAPGPLEYGYRSALYQSHVSVARLVFAPGPLVYGYKPALYQFRVSVAGLLCSTSPGIWVQECTVPVLCVCGWVGVLQVPWNMGIGVHCTSPVCLWLG